MNSETNASIRAGKFGPLATAKLLSTAAAISIDETIPTGHVRDAYGIRPVGEWAAGKSKASRKEKSRRKMAKASRKRNR